MPGSRVIFLLDSRKLPHENTAYMIAKRSTVAIVEATRHLCEGVDFLYVAMPDRNSPKADDADEEVVRILTEEKLPKDKVTIMKGYNWQT